MSRRAAALLLATAALGVGAMRATAEPPAAYELPIDPADQLCAQDADCARVLTRCDDCSDGVAVNARHAARQREALAALCADYRGAHCARVQAVLRPVCRERRCALAPPD